MHPSRAKFFAFVAFTAALLIVIGSLYRLLPPNPDNAVYDYLGFVMRDGGKIYVDAADQNWPGQMYIHMASVSLFGTELTSYRTFELLFVLPLSCLIIGLCTNIIYGRVAALVSVPVYFIMYVTAGYWSSGQRELIAGPLLIGAACLQYLRVKAKVPTPALILGQGSFIFIATLIRPTLLIIFPVLAVIDFMMSNRQHRPFLRVFTQQFLIGVAILLLMSVVALAAYLNDTLAAWWDIAIQFNLNVYGGGATIANIMTKIVSYAISSWHWYLLWSLFGAYFLWKKNKQGLFILLALAPATLISVLAQGKGFIYHLAVIFPLLAILTSIAIAGALNFVCTKNNALYLRAFATLIVLIPAVGLPKKVWSAFSLQRQVLMGNMSTLDMYDRYEAGEYVTVGDVVRASDYIKSQNINGRPILFWGRPCHVYSLTQTKSPLFAGSFALLDEPTSEFILFDDWYKKAEQSLRDNPPLFLLLVKKLDGNGYEFINTSLEQRKISDLVRNNLPNYTLERSFGRVDILRFNGAAPAVEPEP